MKTLSIALSVVIFIVYASLITADIVAGYHYSNTIESYWNLSDRASTLPAKTAYLDQFVSALSAARLEGTYDAIWYQTPDNSFDHNFAALKSLQQRMTEIQSMDVRSFEYQQAIQQITAQEQGEAKQMLSVFEGCWFHEHHMIFWDWIEALWIISGVVLWGCSFAFIYFAYDSVDY